MALVFTTVKIMKNILTTFKCLVQPITFINTFNLYYIHNYSYFLNIILMHTQIHVHDHIVNTLFIIIFVDTE